MSDHSPGGGARAHRLSDFDFALPPELIAQHPTPERSASRLLDGRAPQPEDRIFRELPGLLRPGDLLVFNDTRVLKARIFGEKASGGRLELLIERVLGSAVDGPGNEVVAHMRVSKKPPPGSTVRMAGGRCAGGFDATLLGRWPDAHGPLFRFALHGPAHESPWELMERHGHMPLPPYIARRQGSGHDPDAAQDSQRYQSVFARTPGAVAAPTAALHFDAHVLAALAARGVECAGVTLHVGAGTFQPVKTENLAEHQMHSEWYQVPPATLAALGRCRQRGARVVAVGTTTVRTLESWARTGQTTGDTSIFITPGFRFQVVDVLLTNFHLPRSTLLMLVSAFAGHAQVMGLYRHAIAQRYRFFSYGDAMLLERPRGAP
ncbi:tRNA preQ1(34) S-adenosylmethionine ribosyltransferase-isomerase QueA [Verminephrobacter aporrectodeae subsp. tuberculatae]|uniref:tRNA preQ1(34) S-adenosylmethionine ribosyltransferase-isomerase QueA n=1 Tax=Verminephrobacter aporrectodeae TaxID=1110389 RepID=UPI002243A1FF|nr:tRNA preQ1(34) S-adenosylmethionine ribosyltransferase-isomerase QueA [Verminephrobacter aporrectodeae]MCW8166537.1 tRNA preQ1(34) S-adenosylmethionine ribosyltransferase-isomerase QueA [Verminephrobacter aporrectodeae subsp. tuberculatae]MCW8170619.1 tRNA preQ1(34) S-adenosylmethionine ribosyltransferase-isomerase QueA [Verminephrobacter aporrectodeae subsp. tuberculatae]